MCALAASAKSASANTVTLDNGPGDGTLEITLDGYGSFGDAASGEANYDPVGSLTSNNTTFESAIALRIGGSGARVFLSETGVGSSGNLPGVTNNQNGDTATSSFTQSGLSFSLNQAITPLLDASDVRAGTVLTQTYTITNNGTADINGIEIIRYIDGDLVFGSTSFNNDGGGRLVNDGLEIMFETDTAEGSSESTTFFGITGEGGTEPGSARFEASSFSGLETKIIAGDALDDGVEGDGGDADQFVDSGQGYDITLALRNLFDIPVGGSAVYTTRTFFGSGAPEDVVDPPPPPPPPPPGVIPLPAGVWAGMGMFAALGGSSKLKKLRRR
jgi:hypothetical protein